MLILYLDLIFSVYVFFLSEELLLKFLAKQVYWQQISSLFIFLGKVLFLLHF